jgi:hypothetical protein
MTTSDATDTTSTVAVPRPRTAPDDIAEDMAAYDAAAESTAPEGVMPPPHYPWPEPWHFSRGARPRTEFWHVATSSWRSRGPVA